MNRFKVANLVMFSAILIFLTACGSTDPLSLVKNGTMNGFETTTIQKAFEGSFDSAKWEKFETNKGQVVVQFNGTISSVTHDTAINVLGADLNNHLHVVQLFSLAANSIDQNNKAQLKEFNEAYENERELGGVKYYLKNLYWPVGTPVQVQWTISTDGETFIISNMASSIWEGVEMETILKIIYS